MSRKMILTGLYLGLTAGAMLLGEYSSWAQEKPPAKTPAPTKPLPPAKPIEPLKPKEPAKPRPADKSPDAGQPTVMGSMPDDATRAALAKNVELDFADVPLQKIVDALAAQMKLEIMVAAKDSATTEAAPKQNPTDNGPRTTDNGPTTAPDAGPKQNLTIHLKGVSASSALDLIARDLGWTWFADEGAVVITNDDRLPSVAQVYNVRDLVLAHPNSTGHEDETLDYDYSSLAEVITGAISSPNWSADANVLQDCSPFHGTFTLAQDQKVQDQVAALLAALRKSRDLKPQQYDASVNAGLEITADDETAIDKALAKEVSAQPTAAKLDDLAEWIRKSFGIPVHVDAHAREAGLPNTAAAQNTATVPDAGAAKSAAPTSPETPVTVVGSPLSQALDLLLEDSKLAYTVRDEVLLITTKDDEKSLRTVRVYPVGDLIGGDFDKDGVDEEYGRLLDVITRSVDPDSWASLDKPKSGNAYISYLPTGRAVICTQTRADHGHVAEIVAKLRTAIGEQPAAAAAQPASADGSGKDGSHPLSMKIYKLNADLPADDFVAVVKDLIEPKSWAGEAYIHGVPGAIVVKQTGAIQKRVEKMLIDLNAIPDPKKSPPSGTPTLVGKRRTI